MKVFTVFIPNNVKMVLFCKCEINKFLSYLQILKASNDGKHMEMKKFFTTSVVSTNNIVLGLFVIWKHNKRKIDLSCFGKNKHFLSASRYK